MRTAGARAAAGRAVRWEYTGVGVLAVALAPLALLYADVLDTTPLTVVVGFMVSAVAVAAGIALMATRTWIERRGAGARPASSTSRGKN